MKLKKYKFGFSMTELMVAMSATAVLALIVGSMLVAGWRSWTNSNSYVAMQRDASLAVRVIAREIRSSTNLTIGTSQITCQNAFNTVRFVQSGSDLNMEVDGSLQMQLIDGVLVSFSPELDASDGSVDLILNMAAGDDSSIISETVYPRN